MSVTNSKLAQLRGAAYKLPEVIGGEEGNVQVERTQCGVCTGGEKRVWSAHGAGRVVDQCK